MAEHETKHAASLRSSAQILGTAAPSVARVRTISVCVCVCVCVCACDTHLCHSVLTSPKLALLKAIACHINMLNTSLSFT
jgi:hypothetical protein